MVAPHLQQGPVYASVLPVRTRRACSVLKCQASSNFWVTRMYQLRCCPGQEVMIPDVPEQTPSFSLCLDCEEKVRANPCDGKDVSKCVKPVTKTKLLPLPEGGSKR